MALHYLWESEDFSDSSPIPVLVEIDLGNDNHGDSDTPFANITEHSYFGEAEKEVLFMVGARFRVVEVRRGEKGIWYVRLATLASFNDLFTSQSQWYKLYNHMQTKFIHPLITLPDIGTILLQSGKFDQAQTHYERLLQYLENLVYVPEETDDEEEENEENEDRHELPSNTKHESCGLLRFFKDVRSNRDKPSEFEFEKAYKVVLCYYLLGRITQEKGLFDLSIIYYEAVLAQTSPTPISHNIFVSDRNYILCALCHLGLGATYELNEKLKHAFESYTQALHMFEQAHKGGSDKWPSSSNLTDVYKAHCLVGLGNLALIEQKYDQANKQYREALLLFDKHLPVGHPDQSRTRQKLANIMQIHECKSAMVLEDYEDCLENYLRSLPSDHVDIGRLYADMARACEQLPNEMEKALKFAKKAAKIFEKGLPKEHKDNITICMIVKQIQRKLCLQI
ncbi:unnamed protein product [Adineta steineri]|uniref:Uncharacterized protein n=1 Tax=Adineta steineri TaxID=433720 RepID=A0A814A0M9_9BILA|nr:unnamed protein product [Adineta steineri]CAF3888286.1 unnamed protein product [Adineta steineri]